jgi:hypothetical protein
MKHIGNSKIEIPEAIIPKSNSIVIDINLGPCWVWSRFLVSVIPRDVITDWIVLLHPFCHLLFWMPSLCRRHRLLRLFRRVHTVKHTNTERGRECGQQSLAALFCFRKDHHRNFAPFLLQRWTRGESGCRFKAIYILVPPCKWSGISMLEPPRGCYCCVLCSWDAALMNPLGWSSITG